MAVNNFNKGDLVGESLKRLLSEIEGLATSGDKKDYEALETFVQKLYTELAAETQVINKRDGIKTITVRGQEVDVTNVVGTIAKLIETTRENPANVDQNLAREELFKTMSATIGIFLKEDEIMNELVKRDLSFDEFKANAEEEIAKSEARVKDLETIQEGLKAKSDVFGKTVHSLSKGGYISKSQITKLENDQKAVPYFNKAEQILDQIGGLKSAASKMDPASKEYAVNIKEIERLIGDLKGVTANLNKLGLEGMDFSSLEKVSVTTDIKDIGDMKNDISAKSMDFVKAGGVLIQDYEALKATIAANFAEFGFADEASAKAIGTKEVDKILSDIKAREQEAATEIAYEKRYQKETKDSIEQYKDIVERNAELSKKIVAKKVTKVLKNADGKLVDRDGNVLPEGAQPVTVEEIVYVYSDDARKQQLEAAGIKDEVAYRKTEEDKAVAEVESKENKERLKKEAKEQVALDRKEINKMSRKDARKEVQDEYRKDGKKHFFKWIYSLINPKGYLKSLRDYNVNSYYESYLEQEKQDAIKSVNKEIEAKATGDMSKDIKEFKYTQTLLDAIRADYKNKIASAVSQEKMTDELYRGTTRDDGIKDSTVDAVKEGATRGAATATIRNIAVTEAKLKMVHAQNAFEANKISEAEYNDAVKAYKDAVRNKAKVSDKEAFDRAYASDISSMRTDKEPNTPTFKDKVKNDGGDER